MSKTTDFEASIRQIRAKLVNEGVPGAADASVKHLLDMADPKRTHARLASVQFEAAKSFEQSVARVRASLVMRGVTAAATANLKTLTHLALQPAAAEDNHGWKRIIAQIAAEDAGQRGLHNPADAGTANHGWKKVIASINARDAR